MGVRGLEKKRCHDSWRPYRVQYSMSPIPSLFFLGPKNDNFLIRKEKTFFRTKTFAGCITKILLIRPQKIKQKTKKQKGLFDGCFQKQFLIFKNKKAKNHVWKVFFFFYVDFKN